MTKPDLRHLTNDEVNTMRQRCIWIARIATVAFITALLLGIWVDLRWLPTGLVALFVVGFNAAPTIAVVEETNRRLDDLKQKEEARHAA